MTFLVASKALVQSSTFIKTLLKENHNVIFSQNEEKIQGFLNDGKIDAMIADEENLAMVKNMIMLFPMLNTAIISDKKHEDFHEATEGLGILMQIPKLPEKDHAMEFLKKLQHILNITGEISKETAK